MSTFNVDTTTQSNLSVAYTSSGLNITAIGLPAGTHLGKPLLPVTVSPFKLLIALNSHFSESVDLKITSTAQSDPYSFTIKACTKPVLGSPSATGVIDTTTSRTITIAQTAQTVGYDWTVNGLPTGVTGAGSATKGPSDLYTLSIPANSLFASTSVTVTATSNLVSSFNSSQTFSIGAVVKPVVNSIGTQTFDTTSTATGPTASVTSPSTMNTTAYPITWTVSGGTGVSINSSTGVISVAASSVNNAVTITVTATNGAGSGSTTFTLYSAAFPVINALTTGTTETAVAGTLFTASLSSGSTPVTWSLSGAPEAFTINSTTGAVTYKANSIWYASEWYQGMTITAVVNAVPSISVSSTVSSTNISFGIGYRKFLSNQTWSPSVSGTFGVIAIGGGGNGGNLRFDATGFYNPGGGGGSSVIRSGNYGVSSGTNYTVTVGASGGGSSNFNGSFVAPGGSPGAIGDSTSTGYGGNGGNAASGYQGGAGQQAGAGGGGAGALSNGYSGTTAVSGGNGGDGNTGFVFGPVCSGGGGGGGMYTTVPRYGTPTPHYVQGGTGGNSGGGMGGGADRSGTFLNNGNGYDATTYGSGGGGAGYGGYLVSTTGGAGGPGVVYVTGFKY